MIGCNDIYFFTQDGEQRQEALCVKLAVVGADVNVEIFFAC